MPKLKDMKKVKYGALVVGLKVVVNELDDTYVYTVAGVDALGLKAKLVYYSGGVEMQAGWMDISGLYHPSAEQLAKLGSEDKG